MATVYVTEFAGYGTDFKGINTTVPQQLPLADRQRGQVPLRHAEASPMPARSASPSIASSSSIPWQMPLSIG